MGEKNCSKPYSAVLLNVSAMSYGALSDSAILPSPKEPSMGGFYHNTGEGGISKFHLREVLILCGISEPDTLVAGKIG